jgi:biotin carboxyl carrier protein
MKYITTIGDTDYLIEVVDDKHVRVNEKVLEVDFAAVSGQPVYSLLIDGKSYEAYINPSDEDWEVLILGRLYAASVVDEREKRLRAAGGASESDESEYHLRSPMPGMIVAIPVTEGQQIEKGQVLAILESMKMQNELKSPRGGMVTRIRVKAGDRVEQKATLMSVT